MLSRIELLSCAATDGVVPQYLVSSPLFITPLTDLQAAHIVDWPSNNIDDTDWLRNVSSSDCSANSLNYPALEGFYCEQVADDSSSVDEIGSVITKILTTDKNAADRLSLQIQQFILLGGFAGNTQRADIHSMHFPSIYLIEVYAVNPADHSIVLGKPVKILFQVEPRATASDN